MAKNKRSPIIRYDSGAFHDIANHFKLIVRLMQDRRVSFWIKLLPVGGLIYLINPLDAFIPVVDDLAIMWLSIYAFEALCPPDVVAEHRQAILGTLEGEARDVPDDDIVEGEIVREERDDAKN